MWLSPEMRRSCVTAMGRSSVPLSVSRRCRDRKPVRPAAPAARLLAGGAGRAGEPRVAHAGAGRIADAVAAARRRRHAVAAARIAVVVRAARIAAQPREAGVARARAAAGESVAASAVSIAGGSIRPGRTGEAIRAVVAGGARLARGARALGLAHARSLLTARAVA